MCIRDSDNPIPKPLTDLTSNTYFNISFFTNTKSIKLFTSIPSLPTPTIVYLWILLCLKKGLLTHIPLPSQKSITFLPFSPDTPKPPVIPVSYTHLRAHETPEHLVCRLL